MSNKQYTFFLPSEVAALIDAQPKSAKSQCVTDAFLLKAQLDAQKKVLALLDEIKPQKGASDKDSVALIQDARNIRAQQLIDNRHIDEVDMCTPDPGQRAPIPPCFYWQ